MTDKYSPAAPRFDRASGTSEGLPASFIDVNAGPGAVNTVHCTSEGRQWRIIPLRPVIFTPLNSSDDAPCDDQTKRLHIAGPDSGPLEPNTFTKAFIINHGATDSAATGHDHA